MAGTLPKWLLPCHIQWLASTFTVIPPKCPLPHHSWWEASVAPAHSSVSVTVEVGPHSQPHWRPILQPACQQQLQSNSPASCTGEAALHSVPTTVVARSHSQGPVLPVSASTAVIDQLQPETTLVHRRNTSGAPGSDYITGSPRTSST